MRFIISRKIRNRCSEVVRILFFKIKLCDVKPCVKDGDENRNGLFIRFVSLLVEIVFPKIDYLEFSFLALGQTIIEFADVVMTRAATNHLFELDP